MDDQALKSLLDELDKLVIEYERYETSDQFIVFGLVWAAILTSAAAALLTALSKGSKTLVATLAAIPALCLAIDSSFNFSQQYQLRRTATVDLTTLQFELKHEGLKPTEGSKRMREIVRAFKTGSVVPRLTAGAAQKGASGASK